ncbi:hypothetical protein Sjap_024101 [Stephania japonica]|uniref:2-oxoacid dehydrogenase acyltransferase catalytic domain-containing protein n=1 Tax=Stephania japonica TaxID=461633 RepID=A0AAP0ELG5_9MAGN
MADLEGQDHGPSSSSVGDNDDDFIAYSKEGNNARWFKKEGDEVSPEDILCEVETLAMECTEEVFLAKIIHGDGAKVIKVVNATTMEDEDDIAKFKDYKPSQLGDSKEAKVPSDPSPPTPPRKEDTEPVSSAEPKKPKVANAPQSGSRIFASPLARKLANDHNWKGRASRPPTSKPKDKATEAGINYTDVPISQIRKAAALALRKVPQCNSSWTDEYIRQYHSVNVAVQTEHGLFVPIVRDADKKGLSKIADEVKSFTQKAKENSLKPEDYEVSEKFKEESGGTFTVSNLGGTYGMKQFTPSSIPHNLEYLPSDRVIKVEKRVVPGAEWLACWKSSSHGDSTVSATYGDMDQNTRDVIMGILLTESSKAGGAGVGA